MNTNWKVSTGHGFPLHSPKIVYTNLDPGHYKLTVREKNDSQTICGERSLHIYIRPPFYANLYAYLLYILILCLVLYAIVRFNTRQAKLKASLEFEKKEKKKESKEMNQVVCVSSQISHMNSVLH